MQDKFAKKGNINKLFSKIQLFYLDLLLTSWNWREMMIIH